MDTQTVKHSLDEVLAESTVYANLSAAALWSRPSSAGRGF